MICAIDDPPTPRHTYRLERLAAAYVTAVPVLAGNALAATALQLWRACPTCSGCTCAETNTPTPFSAARALICRCVRRRLRPKQRVILLALTVYLEVVPKRLARAKWRSFSAARVVTSGWMGLLLVRLKLRPRAEAWA